MPLNYDSLPGQLLTLLQAGRLITVRWNCGSDEHIVTIQLDGAEQEFDFGADYYRWMWAEQEQYEQYLAQITNLPILLSSFLAERLRLPSVGEFHMQGGGRIFLASSDIMLEYQSDAVDYVDNPDGWWPEEYLNADELAELCPERLLPGAPEPKPFIRQPDPRMSADYSGREVLFRLG